MLRHLGLAPGLARRPEKSLTMLVPTANRHSLILPEGKLSALGPHTACQTC